MKSKTVREFMVPIEEYATVGEDATLIDAVMALEKAQLEFNQTRYRHRAILVLDESNHVIGKISQHDVIKALEPHYKKIRSRDHEALNRFGLSDFFFRAAMEEYSFWDTPLQNLCEKAAGQKVEDFMYMPSQGEFVEENSTMDEAIHRLILEEHHSLLITRGKEIVGVLRLVDVFEMV
ncbi:MAG: CBS domain-containing protein, partial [Desulfobacteraceae bacterium]